MKPRLLILILLAALAGALSAAAAPAPVDGQTLTGTLTILAGDPRDTRAPDAAPRERFFLHDAGGATVELQIDPAARTPALYRLSEQRVIVSGVATSAPDGDTPRPALAVATIQPAAPLSAAVTPAVSGNTKWLTIACKFADVAAEPQPLSYFTDMYSAVTPGLDHYWREASYNNINLVGSTAVGWYTLPHPVSYYLIDDETLKWDELLADCAALADPIVNFTQYMGINLAFNAEMGCCAWGGHRTITLDGVSKNYAVTWLPPWAFENLAVIHHEMTHAYGVLWHAYAGYDPYGDPWDVVSNCWYYCPGPTTDPVYGCLGQHTSIYHRDYLGWVPAARKVVVGPGETTVELVRPTQPPETGALMAVVPIDGAADHFYALEYRRLIGYDMKVPANSIVIHEIGGPLHAVQLINYTPSEDGQRDYWVAGEQWIAPYGGIMFLFNGLKQSGASFSVTIHSGLPSRTVTLAPTADTYVDATTPDTNYGHAATLQTSQVRFGPAARVTFLRFDNAQIPPLMARARLRLAVVADDSRAPLPYVNATLDTYKDSNVPWTETGLTFNNTWDGFKVPVIWYPSVSAGWYEWDISRIVALRGVSALSVSNGYARAFSSREGNNPPQLVIDYLVPPGQTTTTTLLPTNDATVNSGKKKAVNNTAKLTVRDAAADQNAYVKFNLSGPAGAVQSATLRLWVLDGGPDGGSLYATSPYYLNTTTQWLETGLKWVNAPPIAGAPLAALGAVSPGGWVAVDVTAAVSSNGRVSFALTNDSANAVIYSSGEGAHPPELVVVTQE